MSTVKISQLPAITGANTASDDVIPIVDVSGNTTNKITREEFFKNIQGNVGIGTSSPVANGGFGGLTLNGTTGSIFSLMANGTETGRLGAVTGETFLQSMGSGVLKFIRGAGGTESMRIDASGNVGIGTSSPGGKLAVVSGASTGSSISTWANYAVFGPNAGSSTGSALGLSYNTTSDIAEIAAIAPGVAWKPINILSDNFRVTTNNAERLRIDASGNLLVGRTTVPVQNTAGAGITPNGLIITESAQTQGGLWVNRITSDGNAIYFTRQNVEVGSISVTSSATSYNTSSDYRLKEDLQPISDASSRLAALNPVNFAWKADGTRTDGFIAHEVQAVIPQAVTGEKDATNDEGKPVYQGIDQSKIVPLLTAALQEALTKIEALEARISALEV